MTRSTGDAIPVMDNAISNAPGLTASGDGTQGSADILAGEVVTVAKAAITGSRHRGPWGVSFDGYTDAGERAPGLTFERRWTRPGVHPYDEITWERRTANIASESGKTVFEQKDVEVPSFWSQLATNVVVSKYFRGHVGTPEREHSVKQLIDRVVNTITAWAETQRYFATDEDLRTFQAELTHLLVHQKMAFNSPVWFNVGIEEKPQCSACQPHRALVSTPDGMVPIGELVEQGAVGREVYDANGITRIVAVKNNGRKPVYRVRLRNGNFVEATPDHVVKAVRERRTQPEWMRVDELQVGMRMHLHPHRARVAATARVAAAVGAGAALAALGGELTDGGDSEQAAAVLRAEAALAGWLQADGFVGQYETGTNRSLTIEFQAATDDEYAWVMQNLDVALPHVHVKVRDAGTKETRVQRIRVYGEVVRDFVERWGLLKRGTEIRVPARLWTAPIDEVCAYLRSIFQADGYVSVRREHGNENGRVAFAVIGERWTEDVQLLLNSIGIYSRRLRKHEKRADRHDLHEVQIGIGSERARFAELIGFVGREKQAKLLESLGLRNTKTVPNVREEEIVAIEELGTEEVYDIQTESGEYLSNNVAVHNCFINSVQDTMSSIMDLAKTEAMLFKYGSGAGVNLSTIRSSKARMSGGGIASGPVSFMRGYDAFAGVIKSGGKTRRAAKMVILDADHPDVLDFIDSKANEEKKAWALIEAGYDASFTGEAYGSVFFQNANHSVRVTDDFMRAVERDQDWTTHEVTTGDPTGTYKAREILRRMADAAWICGDPGIQYDTTINDWHTSANTDRIYASNPCSEYMFLNDTACFAPGTRISTPDGLRTVRELFEAQERGEKITITTDLHGEHDHRRLTAHRPAVITLVGERQVYRMKLMDGREIRTTGDHRFLTHDGAWKRVDELQPGIDRVEVRESGNPVRFDADLADVRRWRMLGWMTGDGVFSKGTAGLVFGQEERGTADELVTEFNALLSEARARETTVEALDLDLRRGALLTDQGVFTPARAHASVAVSTAANGVMQFTSQAQPLVRMLEDRYGMHQATALAKDVPSEVHRVPDDLKVAYLQGLFSADGAIMRNGTATEPQVLLASSSPALLRSVQLLLSDLGIVSRTTWTHPAGRKNPQGQLHVFNQAARQFMTLIGFPLSERKQARVDQILTRPFEGARKEARAPKVASIEPDGIETVYDITEPFTHSVIAEGLIAHNCNLASLNLMKFVKDDGEFDVEAYRFAARVTLTAQEILVDNASYPTPRIEENSHRFRPLGMGYANLGALLMSRGLAYDSDEGRSFAAALTAIMTGEGYRQSAVIARDHGGPFADYPQNESSFIRVIGKHRDAAYRIPATHAVPADLLAASRQTWDEALELGKQHGYRNAQVSVLAPTGTIAFMMDCDTTGIEPDIALIKYKKLVGEGYLKIVNQTVPGALRKLGYTPDEVEAIVAYVNERETIEGAPGLRPEHLSVFDCAFKPVNGERSIHYMGHVRMMAAVQPFLSGAISKTVNMPEAATAAEIEQVYLEGWRLGLKAIAIYRDGSKRSQPLSTGKKKDSSADASTPTAAAAADLGLGGEPKPYRRRLPAERSALTHKFDINGHEGYITVGLYPDGQPGEIFLKMAKEGSTVSGLMDTLATSISLALQYGVPLRDLVNKFAHVRFEPAGFTANPEIPIAKSLVDYIFRWLGSRFLAPEEKAGLGLIDRNALVDEPPAGGFVLGQPMTLAPAPRAGISLDAPAPATPTPAAPVQGSGASTAESLLAAEAPASTPATNAPATPTVPASTPLPVVEPATNGHANGNGKTNGAASAISLSLGRPTAFKIQEDAPSCAECGSIMVRNGSCYKCLNCGSTSGCS